MSDQGISRRRFLSLAGAAAILPALGQAQPAAGGQKIRIGVIGNGGRGTMLGGLYAQHGGFEVVACADYFEDRVAKFGDKHKIPAERRFTTLSGYKRMLEMSDLDAVAVMSAPYFHPEHVAAGIDAGKHVYVAKPVAVDVPGCRSIEESGRKAAEKKLVLLVDFQTRANEFYQEALRRVHAGALGTLAYGQAIYHSDRLTPDDLAGNENDAEKRLRNWVFDIGLSGDIIVEQNIHTLDVMNWVMQTPPMQCTGTGGRKGRIDIGDTWDHYACVYEYPDNVGVTFSSRQFNCAGNDEGIRMDMHGSKAVLLSKYAGEVLIKGGKESFYRGGKSPDLYRAGATTNVAAFHKSITEGDVTNPTVEPGVQSNLVAVLGRTATRRKQTVTWKEMLESAETLEADLSGLKA